MWSEEEGTLVRYLSWAKVCWQCYACICWAKKVLIVSCCGAEVQNQGQRKAGWTLKIPGENLHKSLLPMKGGA